MAPNLLVKAAFVRGEFGSENPPCGSSNIECDDRNSIRTDFVLQNVFCHLTRSVTNFRPLSSVNINEENVFSDIIEIVDSFQLKYAKTIQTLCTEIEVTESTLGSVLLGVSNELFCEGITWSRIVAFFVFVGELALQCVAKNYPVGIVDVLYECFRQFVYENLKKWINDHGGWDGIRTLMMDDSGQHEPMKVDSSNKGWAKSILHGTVKMIGTLAQIANSTQSLP